MKRRLYFSVFSLSLLFMSEEVMAETHLIKLNFNHQEALIELEDNPTTQSLLAQLPITVSFSDYAGNEKVTSFPKRLSRENAPKGYQAQVGDVTSYGPWGNLAIFYQDFPYSNGLIYIGKFTSGFENFIGQSGSFEVKLIQVKQ